MSYFNQFKEELQKGLTNSQAWLPLSQGKLGSAIMFGKNMYFVFGGLPGSGKTAIVDTMFVLEPYRWWLKNKDKTEVNPYWIYRSMERSKTLKIAKWLAYLLFVDHGILIDVPTLLQWPNKLYNLDERLLSLIDSYKDFFKELEERIIIIDGAAHPTKVYSEARDFIEKRGKKEQVDAYNTKFIPNNPNDLYIHVTDHVGKLRSEKDATNDKQILDKHSEYMGVLRDYYGATVIDIMQLNRNIEDTYRLVKTDLDVQPSDFKGTSDIYENADIVIGLMNPYKLQVMDYAGYDIKSFVNEKNYNRFRGLKVLKNSYGIDDFRVGYLFVGENGTMVEIPKSSDLDYGKIKNGEYVREFRERSCS